MKEISMRGLFNNQRRPNAKINRNNFHQKIESITNARILSKILTQTKVVLLSPLIWYLIKMFNQFKIYKTKTMDL